MFSWLFTLFRKVKTVDDLARICKDPPALGFWMWNHLGYKGDLEKWGIKDYWQSPQETLSKKNKFGKRCGDCDDWAVLAWAVLQLMGYKPRILCVYSRSGKAHATCCFWWKDTYRRLSNWGFTNTKAKQFEEIAVTVYSDWFYAYEANEHGKKIGSKQFRTEG